MRWEEKDILFLKENYGKIPTFEISKNINRKIGAIRMKAIDLGLKINKNPKSEWNLEKIKFLKENYSKIPLKTLAKKLNVTYDCLLHKAMSLKIKKKEDFIWTDEKDNILINNYSIGNVNFIYEYFKDISKNIILKRIQFLKLKADSHWWNDNEISLLKQVYPNFTNKYISKNYFPNKTPNNIRTMANNMKLYKTKEKGIKWYNSEEILLKLKSLAEKLERTPLISELVSNNLPSDTTYRRYFGGYRKACEILGLKPNYTLFGAPLNVCLSKNNDTCDSYSEVFITNFLIDNNIKYIKNKSYKNLFNINDFGMKRFDWYLPDTNIVVEYFGMMGNVDYEEGVKTKQFLCNKYNINLLSIYPKELKLSFLEQSFL